MKQAGILLFESDNRESLNPDLELNDQVDILPYDRRFEFPRAKLELKEVLGKGAFGIVMKAVAHGIVANEKETVVAVKTINKLAEYEMMKALISELKLMIHLGRHLNIVNLLGAVTRNISSRELMIITEFCCHGNLRDFLRNHRASFGKDSEDSITSRCNSGYMVYPNFQVDEELIEPKVLTQEPKKVHYTADLISWAFQIARGMDYLASRKFLHGDLAARNVLLCENNVVKICDFGLGKSLYKNYNYIRNSETPLPFKWLAIECLEDHVFSVYSDIWAYGILLWELFSLGQSPYPRIEGGQDLYDMLFEGYRMSKPEYASEKVFNIMLDCWKKQPTERPVRNFIIFLNVLH